VCRAVSLIPLLDILIRMMVLGQLLLLAVLLAREPGSTIKYLMLAIGLSVAGLVMLTAPIADEQYGLLRNVLLLLTDAFAFLFWLLIRYLFEDDFHPGRWPRPVKLTLGLLVLVYFYALGIQAGNSPLHDIIHAVGLLLIVHAGYIAFRGFADDLIDSRRRARIMLILGISLYSTVLVVFELVDERYRNAELFGLINAGVLLLAATAAVGRLMRLRYDPVSRISPDAPKSAQAITGPVEDLQQTPILSPAELALAQALDGFIEQKAYQQNSLTITTLAAQLNCPEHRLRRLINQTRGYRNFNSLLNDLRIDDAKQRLADPAYDNTPILSIALGLGYDSIGPFNRAFKAKTDQTPGEFRRSIQNRR